jgi:hypothetical protein
MRYHSGLGRIRHHNGQNDVQKQTGSENEKGKDKNHAYDGWVNVKIIAQPAAYAKQFLVAAFIESLCHGEKQVFDKRNAKFQSRSQILSKDANRVTLQLKSRTCTRAVRKMAGSFAVGSTNRLIL